MMITLLVCREIPSGLTDQAAWPVFNLADTGPAPAGGPTGRTEDALKKYDRRQIHEKHRIATRVSDGGRACFGGAGHGARAGIGVCPVLWTGGCEIRHQPPQCPVDQFAVLPGRV